MRPVIGITSDFELDARPPGHRLSLRAAYHDAILAAGGLPQPLPVLPTCDQACLDQSLASLDGILFTGGRDLNPQHYGQVAHPRARLLHPRRDQFELALFKRADALELPIFAICLGFQVAYVARGGRLIQHLDDLHLNPTVAHHQPDGPGPFHMVQIDPASRLAAIVNSTRIEVNSRHHQAADLTCPARGLRAVAFAPDGLLEAAEDCDGRFILAVQWHPEDLIDRPEHLRLFEALVEAAGSRPGRR